MFLLGHFFMRFDSGNIIIFAYSPLVYIIANFGSPVNKGCFLMEKHIVSENKNLLYIRIPLSNIFY